MIVARSLCRIEKVSTHDIIRQLIRWSNSNPLYMDETMINALSFKPHCRHATIQPTLDEQEVEQLVLANASHRNILNLSNKCLFLAVPLAVVSVHSNGAPAVSHRLCQLMQPNPIAVDGLRVLIAAIRYDS
ncbi:unnamed protein product [Gongylonema pulchrum]|uniref:BACK domain-containing protein n=1 Tax=Gongylonema pulchrum TaxID=637853 RepID=A0A183DE55_9BILA|nr:unnamed protein product [Gongylonema pulchrum]